MYEENQSSNDILFKYNIVQYFSIFIRTNPLYSKFFFVQTTFFFVNNINTNRLNSVILFYELYKLTTISLVVIIRKISRFDYNLIR